MRFRVGLPREHLKPNGEPVWQGLAVAGFEDVPALELEWMPERFRTAPAALLQRYDAIIASSNRYAPESFLGVERLVLIARFGVGHDGIDLEAATRAGVLVTITKGAADRPVAEGALTLMLALGHQVRNKDRLLRLGRWEERHEWTGVELRDRTIGVIGFGGVGRELVRLLQPFGAARLLVCDPYVDEFPEGVEPAPLEALLRESDFVSVHCPLTPETQGLIGERQLALMKPTAFLINTARGPIVDQEALARALRERRIRGAALDVFREEPIAPHDPLIALDNVILTPHAIAVTEELYRDYQQVAAAQVVCVSRGQLPPHVVNPEVIGSPLLQAKLERLRGD